MERRGLGEALSADGDFGQANRKPLLFKDLVARCLDQGSGFGRAETDWKNGLSMETPGSHWDRKPGDKPRYG